MKGETNHERYVYESDTEYYNNEYHTITKLYDTTKFNNSFDGCHWDNPTIIASEQVDSLCMSDDMANLISRYKAEEMY